MTYPTLLVLDFDGVICDSIDETFASSWIAWRRLRRSESSPGADGNADPSIDPGEAPPRSAARVRSPAAFHQDR